MYVEQMRDEKQKIYRVRYEGGSTPTIDQHGRQFQSE